jgi:AcrR family transcriptional regulator
MAPPPSPPSSLLVRKEKSFKQNRSAATHEALVRAARVVFEEKGFEGAQTHEIAATAGVSTGAFYRYFEDKHEVFLDVLAEHLGEGRELVRRRLSPDRFVGADARTAIAVVVDVLFEVVRRDARLHKVFMATSMSDPKIAALRAEFEDAERNDIAQLIGGLVSRDVVPSPEAAALVVQVAALEVAVDQSGMRTKTGPAVDEREVKRALVEMFYRYLFASKPPRTRARKGKPRRESAKRK